MWDQEVQRFSRLCCVTGQNLEPGQAYYSALFREKGQIVRRDFSAAAWTDPPKAALSWWQGTVPDPRQKTGRWAPTEVLLGFFEQLEEEPQWADLRYVLSLLLLRKRLLRLEREEGSGEDAEMELYCPKLDRHFTVACIVPSADRLAGIERQLSELLDGNESP